MNNKEATQTVYVSILEQLLETCESVARFPEMSGLNPADLLMEYRTVGFLVGRQCGKSGALLKWNHKYDGSCLNIVMNSSMRRSLLERHSNEGGDKPIGGFMVSDTLRKRMNEWQHIDSRACIAKMKSDYGSPKYIIVDDASVAFSFLGIKRRAFYQFIAACFGKEVFVILLG